MIQKNINNFNTVDNSPEFFVSVKPLNLSNTLSIHADKIIIEDDNISINWNEKGVLNNNYECFNKIKINLGNKSYIYIKQ